MANVIDDDLITVPHDTGTPATVKLITTMPATVTPYIGGNALRAFITVEGGKVRYRYNIDGSHAVSNARGHLMAAGDALLLDSNMNTIEFRSNASETADTTLTVTYSLDN